MGISYPIVVDNTPLPKKTIVLRSIGNRTYDTTNCKPGCIEKVYTEREDSLFEKSIWRSPIFNIPLLLRITINKDSSSIFSLLNNDITNHIISLFIEYSVKERIEKSILLEKSWRIKYYDMYKHYDINPPEDCVYGTHKSYFCMIKNNGCRYSIPNYFWVDDIYNTDICYCPLRNERLRLENERKITFNLHNKHPSQMASRILGL